MTATGMSGRRRRSSVFIHRVFGVGEWFLLIVLINDNDIAQLASPC